MWKDNCRWVFGQVIGYALYRGWFCTYILYSHRISLLTFIVPPSRQHWKNGKWYPPNWRGSMGLAHCPKRRINQPLKRWVMWCRPHLLSPQAQVPRRHPCRWILRSSHPNPLRLPRRLWRASTRPCHTKTEPLHGRQHGAQPIRYPGATFVRREGCYHHRCQPAYRGSWARSSKQCVGNHGQVSRQAMKQVTTMTDTWPPTTFTDHLTYTTQHIRHLPTLCENYHRAGSQSVTRLFAFWVSESCTFVYTFLLLQGVKSLVSLPTHHLLAFRCGAAETRG